MFWEDHKIWKKISHLDLTITARNYSPKCQNYLVNIKAKWRGRFFQICGPLRKLELYYNSIFHRNQSSSRVFFWAGKRMNLRKNNCYHFTNFQSFYLATGHIVPKFATSKLLIIKSWVVSRHVTSLIFTEM